MGNYDQVLSLLMEVVSGAGKAEKETRSIPLGISNRHVHLAQADVETLFGAGYALSKMRDLSQPGQYACNETVTVCGPKGPSKSACSRPSAETEPGRNYAGRLF